MIWAIAFDADEHGAALGRIAIREPSSKESRLDLLEWVAHVRKVKLNSALLKSIKKRSRTIGNQRNLIAHGLWTELDQGWMVQQTRGAWLEYKGGPRGSKRITPESVPLSIEDLRSLTAEIETVIEDIKALKDSIGEA